MTAETAHWVREYERPQGLDRTTRGRAEVGGGNKKSESVLDVDRSEHANGDPQAAKGQVSMYATTMNLITGALGAGILSLPWSTAGASLITGAVICAVVLILNAWTIMILIEASEKYQVFDLGALLSHLPGRLGPVMQAITNVAVWLSMGLCLVGYMVMIADSATKVASGSRRFWVLAGSAVVLPICFLDQEKLAFTSTLAILVNIYLFLLIFMFYVTPNWIGAESREPGGICFLGLTKGSVAMFSAVMQAVIIQMCVLPMYKDLDQRSPKRFRQTLYISFSAVFLLFVAFSSFSVLAIGPNVQSNVLLDLPRSSLSNIAQLGMLVVVLGVYPIMVNPMVEPVRTAVGSGHGGNLVVQITTAVIVVAAMIAGFFVTELGLMNVLNGAFSLGIFVFLVPSLVGAMLLARPGPAGHVYRVVMACLFVAGLIMSGCGLVFLDNYVDQLTPESCMIMS